MYLGHRNLSRNGGVEEGKGAGEGARMEVRGEREGNGSGLRSLSSTLNDPAERARGALSGNLYIASFCSNVGRNTRLRDYWASPCALRNILAD